MTGRELVKSRRHEQLVTDFALKCAAVGYHVSSDHPTDLVLRKGPEVILVEAKVIYRGNATEAVRAAVGQLFSYAYFLFNVPRPLTKIALFSEPIGDAYVEFLASLNIGTVWHQDGDWRGWPKYIGEL